LCVKFRRLYKLADTRGATVTNMFSLGWGEGCEACRWRRRLLALEEEQVRECRMLLLSVTLQVVIND